MVEEEKEDKDKDKEEEEEEEEEEVVEEVDLPHSVPACMR